MQRPGCTHLVSGIDRRKKVMHTHEYFTSRQWLQLVAEYDDHNASKGTAAIHAACNQNERISAVGRHLHTSSPHEHRFDLRWQAVGEYHQSSGRDHRPSMRFKGQWPRRPHSWEPTKLLLRFPPELLWEHVVLVQLPVAAAHSTHCGLEGPWVVGLGLDAMWPVCVGTEAQRILPRASRAGSPIRPGLAIPCIFGLLQFYGNTRNSALKHESFVYWFSNSLHHYEGIIHDKYSRFRNDED